jgi:hypothetical protein
VRKLSPLQDALLFTVAVLIIAVILLITVLFPPAVRSDQPTVYAPLPSSAFSPIPEPSSRIAPEPATPAPSPPPSPAPSRTPRAPAGSTRIVASISVVAGVATWYAWRPGEAAAGPGLRSALGPDWRGTVVIVTAGARSVRVRLTDWCACPGGRVIDLDSRSFAALAPLSAGVLSVSVAR